MPAVAKVIAIAFANGMFWAGMIEGQRAYCQP